MNLIIYLEIRTLNFFQMLKVLVSLLIVTKMNPVVLVELGQLQLMEIVSLEVKLKTVLDILIKTEIL